MSAWSWNYVDNGNTRHLRYGGLYVGDVHLWTLRGDQPKPWRAWLMHDDEGDQLGWYATAGEAQVAMDHAGEMLLQGGKTFKEIQAAVKEIMQPISAT